MITKRLTTEKRLVSHFDESYVSNFTDEQRDNYSSTLNIDDLGSFANLKTKPTIFKVAPLKTKYEYLAYSDSPDAWGIFSTHVTGLEYCNEIELTYTNGVIDDHLRECIPPRIVQNIASMIIALANITGDECFFLQSVASLHFSQKVMMRNAQKRMVANAPTVAVKVKPTK